MKTSRRPSSRAGESAVARVDGGGHGALPVGWASGHRQRWVVARGRGDGTGEGEGGAERSSVEQLEHQPERSTASR